MPEVKNPNKNLYFWMSFPTWGQIFWFSIWLDRSWSLFGCFYTLYDKIMYSIFIDLLYLRNKCNIEDISIFYNLFVEYRLWSNHKKLEKMINESRKTCSEGMRMILCYHYWVLFIIHYKQHCRIFSDEQLPSSVYLKSPEELIWAFNNFLLIFSTY